MSSLCVIVMLTDTAGCIGAWLKFLCTIHRLTDFFFLFFFILRRQNKRSSTVLLLFFEEHLRFS